MPHFMAMFDFNFYCLFNHSSMLSQLFSFLLLAYWSSFLVQFERLDLSSINILQKLNDLLFGYLLNVSIIKIFQFLSGFDINKEVFLWVDLKIVGKRWVCLTNCLHILMLTGTSVKINLLLRWIFQSTATKVKASLTVCPTSPSGANKNKAFLLSLKISELALSSKG